MNILSNTLLLFCFSLSFSLAAYGSDLKREDFNNQKNHKRKRPDDQEFQKKEAGKKLSQDSQSDGDDEERPLKRQKGDLTASVVEVQELWLPSDLIGRFFLFSPFRIIQTGKCVSKQWNKVLTSDDFCNLSGNRFSPSTSQNMNMTPLEFLEHWVRPRVWLLPVATTNHHKFSISTDINDVSILALPNNMRKTFPKFIKDHYPNGLFVPDESAPIEFYFSDDPRDEATLSESFMINVYGTTIIGTGEDKNGMNRPLKWENNSLAILPEKPEFEEISTVDIAPDCSWIIGDLVVQNNEQYVEKYVKWTRNGVEYIEKKEFNELQRDDSRRFKVFPGDSFVRDQDQEQRLLQAIEELLIEHKVQVFPTQGKIDSMKSFKITSLSSVTANGFKFIGTLKRVIPPHDNSSGSETSDNDSPLIPLVAVSPIKIPEFIEAFFKEEKDKDKERSLETWEPIIFRDLGF